MPWYYAQDGQERGPVAEAEFDRMTAVGVIMPETLVWRQGMAAWQPWSAVRTTANLVPPILAPAPAGGGTCCECGGGFPADELVQILGQPVCAACKPLHLQRLQERGPVAAEGMIHGVWREGKLLILRTGAVLPPRCVRCNQPATWTGRIKLSWNPPWIYLTFLLSPLVLLIVVLFTHKTATVVLPLCETHRRQRAVGRVVAGIAIVVGLLLMGLGWLISSEVGVIGLACGILFILINAIIASRASWVLNPQRIDKEYARLKGCCPEFLDRLPPCPGA